MTAPLPWIVEVERRLAREWPTARLALDRTGRPEPRPAAVLVPLYVRDRELWTLFTKRTDLVEHHKGQISFPGGVREPGDATLWDTAIRETEEEIGVARASVRKLGTLPGLVTVTDFEISPFVGAVPYPLRLSLEAGEVESVIEIPISFLMNPDIVEERILTWKGQKVPTPVYHYKGHAIWGATAWVLSNLLTVLGPEPQG